MKIHKIAAIDIGSNSVRLLVANVIQYRKETLFKKSSLTRLPVRLGTDAFTKGKISKRNASRLVMAMDAYAKIMAVHEVVHYRACATSALREVANGADIVAQIRAETGINIELIDGTEEARLIFNSEQINELQQREDRFLYIDVGGGSTELTYFYQGQVQAGASFKIGTIRLLNNKVADTEWREMKKWIKKHRDLEEDTLMIGSGGNINRVLKMDGGKSGNSLDLGYLQKTLALLEKFSVKERILKFDLNPDRADVITHALQIYTAAMDWAGAHKMMVPKKGLADGMVRDLYLNKIMTS